MIYFDNAATSPLLPEVKQFITRHFNFYGNPSSLHSKGYQAKELLENARNTIASCINAKPEDIYFVSGGTEADVQALYTGSTKSGNILISSFEHPAISANAQYMFFDVEKIFPNISGIINANEFGEMLNSINFASIMHVNNEIGSIQPIKEMSKIAHEKNCVIHSDMTQSMGHIPIDIKDIGVDMATASAHKFGGPRGIGFLYCNSEKNIFPYELLKGGLQERGYRAGTENVIGAAAMALALKNSVDNLEKNTNKVLEMRSLILEGLVQISGVRLNGSMVDYVPGIINVSFKNLRGDEIQSMLDDRGIAVSTGSACHSGVNTPSNTLVSIGVPNEYINGTIRISLSHMNTMNEAEDFIRSLTEVIEILRRY